MLDTPKKPSCSDRGISDSLKHFDELPDSAQVRVGVVAALHDCKPVTVWRWSKSGKLPAPQKLGGVTAWNVGELRRARAARRVRLEGLTGMSSPKLGTDRP